jgi:hypothetical protein
VAELAKIWRSDLHVLFVGVTDTFHRAGQQKIIQRLRVAYGALKITASNIESNDEEWGIHQFAELIEADMITITAHDQVGRFFSRSVAEGLAGREKMPVLVIH